MKTIYLASLNKYITIIVFLFLFITAAAQTDAKLLRQGNRKYSDSEYPASEVLYRKALERNSASEKAIFNLGDALYRQKKFDEAGNKFSENSELLISERKKADSYYNLGNSMLNNKKISEAIDAYKKSLRLNPGNLEAKYNLAYAQDMIEKQKQPDKNQDEKKKENKEDQKKEDQKEQQNKGNQEQQQQTPQQQQSISKEDAQRLLDALANDEKKVQEKVKEAKAANARIRTMVNW